MYNLQEGFFYDLLYNDIPVPTIQGDDDSALQSFQFKMTASPCVLPCHQTYPKYSVCVFLWVWGS